jgi:hypothetical protein
MTRGNVTEVTLMSGRDFVAREMEVAAENGILR